MAVDIPPEGLAEGPDGEPRCWWACSTEDYVAYHDTEWGFPVDDDRRLFEKLSLEGFQSGLSWLTILRKRPAFREVFAGFDPEVVAGYGPHDVERLLGDARIVRHRGKIEATINNAGRLLDLRAEAGSLAAYAWSFEPIDDRPSPLDWDTLAPVTTNPAATAMAKDLKRRGWRFVGPTTVYAFMEAMGLVNDHLDGCIVRPRVAAARAGFVPPARDGVPSR